MRRAAFLIIGAVVGCALPACHRSADDEQVTVATSQAPAPAVPSASAPVAADAQREAREVYQKRCAVCHGEEGRGDGPGAAAVTPRPRDFTTKAWQSEISDDEIRSVTLGGGPAVGKSAVMPANPDLKQKPDVLVELVELLRSFRGR
jgi:mono/diheme cytochrome c family protein